jgi:transposase
MDRKRLVYEQILKIGKARLKQLRRAPRAGPNLMVLLLMGFIGIGIHTADTLVKGVPLRNLRDGRQARRARYGGLTGSPHESGKRRREKGSPDPATRQSDAGWQTHHFVVVVSVG